MVDIESKAQQVSELGYCVVESVYDEGECERIRAIFKVLCDRRGGFAEAVPKLAFHPLLEKEPELAPFFAKPVLVDLMAAVFGDAVRLAHSGAAISDNALGPELLTGWHNHYSWPIADAGLQRERPQRLLCNVYVDGTMPDIGPLIVLPRSLNESIEGKGESVADWQGQVEVGVPPGAAVIFDTALWHKSKRGMTKGLRHLWGGHYQGWGNATVHPEDNMAHGPVLDAYKGALPVLQGLLDGPAG